MFVPLLIVARLPSDPAEEKAVAEGDSVARTRLAPLVGYAFTLPVFHFLMERLGVVEDDTAGPREMVVLVFLGAAACLLWIYQRVLIRDNERLERERALMSEQTAQATRLEAIGRLAGGVAHDFNNLLTVIRGRTELMLAEHQHDETLREDLTAVRDATRRGEGVTRQLLAFGRRQMLRPEVLDLGLVVADMAPLLRSAISDEVRLSVTVRDPAPLILADQGQVEMALLNLAVNAREAMPGGGKLAVSVDDVELDEGTAADIPEARPGRYVLLTVQDTGKGMNEATRSRIFEPFFTTKPFGSGAGLGLPAVHGFVRQSGGAVAVESAPAQGATFRIYLPRVDPSAADAARELAAAANGGVRG
jgi:signal transduction histidine kinase